MKHCLSAVFVLVLALSLTGCGGKTEDEPTRYQSQDGLEALTRQAQTSDATAQNSQFSAAKNITPTNATARDIDGIIRPVLTRQFKDAKLVSAQGPEPPQKDGEVVEDRMAYTVGVTLTEPAGDTLHQAFRSAGFAASPRLGSKPTHSRGNVYMSLMRTTSQRGYSFVITVNTDKQQIEVVSYKLGSKYDRMM